MHTVKLQIQDHIYYSITSKWININNKIQEFLYTQADDGYSSISTNEAKKSVTDAVDRYTHKTGIYVDQNKYKNLKAEFKNTLQSKYANN